MKYITNINNNEYIIEINGDDQIMVNDEPYQTDLQQLTENGLLSLIIDNRSFEAAVEFQEKDHWHVLIGGEVYEAHVQDERAYRLAKARGELDADTGEIKVKAPMPGVVVKVPVVVGDSVAQGQTVVILESMKMENELKSTRDGVVLSVNVTAGDSVEKDTALVVIGDPEADA